MLFNDPDRDMKYARIEEERRFLLKLLPEGLNESSPFIHIIDRYIRGTRLRLRCMESLQGDTLAMKLGQKYQPGNFEKHQTLMTNIYLTAAEYDVLFEMGADQIFKRRYPFEVEKQHYGIDVYEGDLQGLIIAEIESQPGLDLTQLPVPQFAHQEITGDLVFNGAKLAGLKSDQIHQILLDYQVI
jgi:CYTH domain-containing protein